MPRRALFALALFLTGCVSAYDPSSPGRMGMETRAQEVGVKEERPWSRGRRVPPRPAPEPAVVEAPQPAPEAPATLIAVPDSPAGAQFTWWLGVLRGGDTKRLDGHFTPAFLEKVPPAKMREIARAWRRDEMSDGPVELVRIEEGATPDKLTAIVRGTATDRYTRILLGVDGQGQIGSLWLGPLVGYKRADLDTWAKIDARLGTLPGAAALASYELDGPNLRPVHVRNA